jgi:hypothetical protein
MERYLVEGLYIPKPKSKKTAPSLEPFARSYWANSAPEAIRMATEDLQGGVWQKPPRASQTSEEQRMRQQGQPELPGFGSAEIKKQDGGGKAISKGSMKNKKSDPKGVSKNIDDTGKRRKKK